MDTKRLKNINNIDLKIPGLRIISEIGEGGMSVVYLAEQISLKREIAVKVMRIEIAKNDLDVQRFKHEAKTIARLDHPNIINIYNIGQTSSGEIFFTMPYLNHGDFSDYILEDESEFIKLLSSICDGLQFAHNRGVVHRDIKPENLLFDKFGNVKIADFGIAVSKDGTRMTQEHQIVGSAQYMSPEQARSLKVGPQTDVYSLGIVIYERLTGNVPFDGVEGISILVDHVSTEPPKLSSKMRHWQKIIDKCLAKLPEDRFQSMNELKLALASTPTNALQRTNDSIQNALKSDAKKHLKWFIPSLLVLIAFAFLLHFRTSNTDKAINIDILSTTNTTTIPKKETSIKGFTVESKTKLIAPSKLNQTPSSQIILKDGFSDQTTLVKNINTDNQGIDTQQLSHAPIEQSTIENDDETKRKLENLLNSAFKNIKNYQLSRPKNNNATDQILQALEIDPDNELAIKGIENIGGKYYQLIKNALFKYRFNTALKHARSLTTFNTKTNSLNRKHKLQINGLISSIQNIDITSNDFSIEKVKSLARIVKIIDSKNPLIAQLNIQARSKLKPKIGEVLLDEKGIETVLISNTVAASTTETTINQYKEFSNQTNRTPAKCKQRVGGGSFFGKKTWEKHFFTQNDNHPVVCITQADAGAYAKWLSEETGNRYRLPTKNEWIFIYANANKNFKVCESGNLAGNEANKLRNKETNYSCNDNFKFTAAVANFTKQNNGIYDIQGNVSEWVSCNSANCQTPIAMGSSWLHGEQSNKSIHEEKLKVNSALSHIGFRVVRDL